MSGCNVTGCSKSSCRDSPGCRQIVPRALRSVSRAGGLDAFLLRANDNKLAPEGLRLKHRVKKALAGKSAKAS